MDSYHYLMRQDEVEQIAYYHSLSIDRDQRKAAESKIAEAIKDALRKVYARLESGRERKSK